MNRSTLRLLAVAVAALVTGATSPGARAVAAPPPADVPSCGVVRGIGAVSYTTDEGKTVAPLAEHLSGNLVTTGLVALDQPGLLLAESEGSLYVTRDGGCTWTQSGALSASPVVLTAAGATRAYAWSDNGSYFARIDERGIHELVVPMDSILGVGVDPADGRHVRIGGGVGSTIESFDGGETWTRLGPPPPGDELTLAYRVAFDPKNVDHVVLGRSGDGAWASFDGGVTWERSRAGQTPRANVFNLVISPADPNVVWAMGLALDQTDTGWGGRYVARSTDGGRTFSVVLRQTKSVTLRNGPVMAAHPTDPNVLYFVFGTFFSNYGTDVYKYDARTGRVVTRHNAYPDVNAIAFSKTNPGVMYLGLETHTGE